MGHVGMGWGGLCRGGVGWVMQGWGGVGHAGVGWVMKGGWGGSCRGGVGHRGVNGENNRCYSHLSPMQNDANQCDKESL